MKNILYTYYIFIRDFFKDLFDDKIGYYASSLSWSTLFSIVPLMVTMLWVFTTLPIFENLYASIEEFVFASLMPTSSQEIMKYINNFILNADQLGMIGIAYVIFAVFMFFKNFDFIINDIFEIPSRNLRKAIRTYLLLIVAIPTMMGLSFYISTFVQFFLDKNSILSTIHLLYFIPYFIIWGIFYLIYQISPHTKVSPKAAAISSFASSIIWYLSKSGFIFYVIHNKTYASIYGSISIMLFFFLWIYISWAIFLHGVKICDMLNKEYRHKTNP